MGFSKRFVVASVSLAAIAAGSAASAQDANNGSDIIVTARRVEERLQDVPISITVLNQQQIANRNIVTGEDLARYTPGLSTNTNFGADNTTFALRGFVQDVGTAPSVGVYLADVVALRGPSNGLPVGDGAGPGSFFDLQNVQMLKGPQGTLFGRNTTGGAILLVPTKPTSKFEGYIEGSYGNYGLKRIQGVLNVPINDTFRIRASVDHDQRDGYLLNTSGVGTKHFNDIDYTAARVSIVGDLTPNLENYTIVSYSRSTNHGTFQKIISADPTDALGFFAANQLAGQSKDFWSGEQDVSGAYSKTISWQVINTTTWEASDTITIKNIASYGQLTQDVRSPVFGTHFVLDPTSGFFIDFAGTNRTPNGHTAAESTATEELQLQGRTADGKLTYQAGGYLEVSEPLGNEGSQGGTFAECENPDAKICGAVPPFPSGVNYNVGRTAFHDVGAYAQATYKFTDKLRLTGGIRYTWDHETSSQQLIAYTGFPTYPSEGSPTTFSCINPDSAGALPDATGRASVQPISAFNPATTCRINFRTHSSAPTWVADLDYNPMQDLLLYAKYSRGYRAAVINPTLVGSFNYVNPEKVDTYEIGAKTSFTGALKGYLNVAGFYNNFDHQQTQLGFGSLVVSPAAGPVNLGKSRIWGIEVEGSITPFKGFTLDGGYEYLNTKIKSIPDYGSEDTYPYILEGIPLKGDPLALAPKNKVTITGTYTLPLDPAIGKISVGATFTHTDRQLSNYNDKLYVGTPESSPATVAEIRSESWLQATNLVNLNLSWNSMFGSHFDGSLFVTNLTNEKYYTFIPGLASTAGFEDANVGEPRMFGGRLRFRFGK